MRNNTAGANAPKRALRRARASRCAPPAALAFLAGCLALIALPAGEAAAQETIYVGGDRDSSVVINLDVLDALRPDSRPGEIGLRHPGDREAAGPITLRPPGATRATARPIPKPRRAGGTEPSLAREAPRATHRESAAEPPPRPVRKPAMARAVATPDREPAPRQVAASEPEPAPEPEPITVAMAEATAKIEPAEAPPEPPPEPVSADPVVPEPAASEPAAAEPGPAEPSAPAATTEPAAETVVAAIDPSDLPQGPGDTMRIAFPPGDAELPAEATGPLGAVSALLQTDDSLRLQLRAYAGGDANSASQARRLSLSRALAVRSFFIEQGVRSTRIDVRALGNRVEDGPSDRVDVNLMAR